MAFEITGKLIEKYNEVQVSDTFKKREFVIEKQENNFTDFIKSSHSSKHDLSQ